MFEWEDWPVFERFTDRARRVLVLAQQEASRLNHDRIGTEHFLLGLIREGDCVAANVLDQLGLTLEAVQNKVAELNPLRSDPPTGSPPFTPRAKKVLELSLREALDLGNSYIGTEHLLLALVREGDGLGAHVLRYFADPPMVREEIMAELSGAVSKTLPPASTSPAPSAQLVACSFCGRRPPESGRLVQGLGAFICEHCIEEWGQRLAGAGNGDQEQGPGATLYEPEDDGGEGRG